jgi:hypothetical protein
MMTLHIVGRFVTFYSWADNLVPNDTNAIQGMYVYERVRTRYMHRRAGRLFSNDGASFSPGQRRSGNFHFKGVGS